MQTNVKKGDIIAEGKTKVIYQAVDNIDHVLIVSKDSITAGNGLKVNINLYYHNTI
jgi:hypothetical protein